MSTQTPKQTMVQDQWKPVRRVHGGLRQIRHTKDGRLVFNGQDPDEEVKLAIRQHSLFLLKPALPALGALLLLIISSVTLLRLPNLGPLGGLLDLVLAVGFLIALGYFGWRDFLIWWVNVDIVTSKRVIICRGFVHPTRRTITLDKIVQVSTEQASLLSIFLDYGNVHIYMTGGIQVLKNVPRPKEIRDAVDGIFREFKAAKPAEKLPPLVDPEMSALIARLGKREKVPTLPNADERYRQGKDPESLRRPQRRFGGPLRIPAEVTYASDEQTVMYIQRSKWLLAIRLVAPVAMLIAVLVLTFIFTAFALITVLVALALLVVIGLITINYVDDIFILTNKRVIDIERKYIFFYEARVEAEYKNIRDIKTRINNLIQNILDVGSVYVETPGNNPDINITLVDHPFFITDKINEIKSFKEKADKAKNKNERQDELVRWFTNVAAVLERKMVSRGVPNLQTMDLWDAAAMVAEMGMKVIPVGEDDSYPQIPAGRIVSQVPPPGTLVGLVPGSPDERPQIQVIISKHS